MRDEFAEVHYPASNDLEPMTKPGDAKSDKQADVLTPSPMELAKLAAILCPDADPPQAMEGAMRFYVEAELFCREHSSWTRDELIREFGSPQRGALQDLERGLKAAREDTLEFDPAKEGATADPARRFLSEHGVQLKMARAVLVNLRQYLDAPQPNGVRNTGRELENAADWPLQNVRWPVGERQSAKQVLDECKRELNGKTTYALSRSLLQGLVNWKRSQRQLSKLKGAATKKKKALTAGHGHNGKGPAPKTVKRNLVAARSPKARR